MARPAHSDAAVAAEQRPHYLGHHYDTVEQQFSSGKLGMWLFLATEILLFSGLFCAYAIFRRFHPEVFEYAHTFLDTKLGAINTLVLIFSSLTMALGVRASQKGQTKLLIALLSVTFLCGVTFMGIKYTEYAHKWHDGLLWGTRYVPHGHEAGHGGAGHGEAAQAEAADGEAADGEAAGTESAHAEEAGTTESAAMTATAEPAAHGEEAQADETNGGETGMAGLAAGEDPVELDPATGRPHLAVEGYEPSVVARASTGPVGLAPEVAAPAESPVPKNVHWFFGIYFLLTGLHGLHVLIGMTVIAWLIVRAAKGHFGPEYFTPVDLGGLYWHLVDLIWIYLFPLLYLIK